MCALWDSDGRVTFLSSLSFLRLLSEALILICNNFL